MAGIDSTTARGKDPFSVVEQLGRLIEVRTIFDVGAFRGLTADRFRSVFRSAAVRLFEPQADYCKGLTQKFAGDAQVSVHNLALSDTDGYAEFHLGAFPATSSLFPRATGPRYFDAAHVMVDRVPVAVRRLDHVCAEIGVRHIEILKLDTQGAELQILKGAGSLLSEQRIDIILTEFFAAPHYEGAPLFDEIWSCLRTNGYNLHSIYLGLSGPDGQLRFGDAIFISDAFRRDHLAKLAKLL
ncbi:MAG: FkbM family methyltransferase [Hyphomicrobium sp.]|nr:FkbM family methyltransferase [Hyphomicrobium sp.]